jgi:hypothetical protein
VGLDLDFEIGALGSLFRVMAMPSSVIACDPDEMGAKGARVETRLGAQETDKPQRAGLLKDLDGVAELLAGGLHIGVHEYMLSLRK